MAKLIAQHTIETTDWDNYDAEYEKGLAEFREWAKKCSSDKLAGETISFPVADGYAVYGIVREKPLHLCYINHGDCWQIPDAHLRGLRLTDVRQMVKRDKAMKDMFARKS
jgi:hypothetical protein